MSLVCAHDGLGGLATEEAKAGVALVGGLALIGDISGADAETVVDLRHRAAVHH